MPETKNLDWLSHSTVCKNATACAGYCFVLFITFSIFTKEPFLTHSFKLSKPAGIMVSPAGGAHLLSRDGWRKREICKSNKKYCISKASSERQLSQIFLKEKQSASTIEGRKKKYLKTDPCSQGSGCKGFD